MIVCGDTKSLAIYLHPPLRIQHHALRMICTVNTHLPIHLNLELRQVSRPVPAYSETGTNQGGFVEHRTKHDSWSTVPVRGSQEATESGLRPNFTGSGTGMLRKLLAVVVIPHWSLRKPMWFRFVLTA